MIKLVGWVVVIIAALAAVQHFKEAGMPSLPQLGPVPWEHVDATSFSKDCRLDAVGSDPGGPTYRALGEHEGQVLSFERPCSDPPPERLR